MKCLLIDNYDSFTYNLYDLVKQCGVEVEVVRNDELSVSQISSRSFDNILISPGPKEPLQAGITMALIEAYASRLPILGICLGHQALGIHFGMKLVKLPEPRHGKTSTILFNEGSRLFSGQIQPFSVMRYHSLTLDKENVPPCLNVTALSTDDKQIMAFEHKDLPLAGMQFHPESILTPDGLCWLNNWFELIR